MEGVWGNGVPDPDGGGKGALVGLSSGMGNQEFHDLNLRLSVDCRVDVRVLQTGQPSTVVHHGGLGDSPPGFLVFQLQPGYNHGGTACGTVVVQDAACRVSLRLLRGVRQVLPVRIQDGGSILHDGPNHAIVAVCLDRDRAALEDAVHDGTGLVGLRSYGRFDVRVPVHISCSFHDKVFCFGEFFFPGLVRGGCSHGRSAISSSRHSRHDTYLVNRRRFYLEPVSGV